MYVLLCNVCMYKYAREHVEYVYIYNIYVIILYACML